MFSSAPNMLPRGIRNKNPLNIRVGNAWLGEVENPTDTNFEQFVSVVYGLRAAFVLLRRYIERYHIDTVETIISRWAPASENATGAYITFVASRMQCPTRQMLDFNNRTQMCDLVCAMARYENGIDIERADVEQAYDMLTYN